jgi:predicted alpha/beta superfamily hydrolase
VAFLVAALASIAIYSGWRVHRWRRAEAERRVRAIHTLTGNVTRHAFRSDVFGSERHVWVYLPPGYEDDESRYPVLYMHDGQNVFDGATAFIAGKEWRADETAEQLIDEGRIEPLIIVAVDNGGESRIAEYTPSEHEGRGGGADAHRRMLIEEVKPWVDGTWRTRPGREDTGLAGSSLGGLVSLWIGLSRPETFGKVAALSTSVWWDDGFILRFVESLPEAPAARIWVDTGTREGDRSIEGNRRLRDALTARGWREGVDLRYVEAEGAPHSETAWAGRFPAVLEFLYPPRREGQAGELPSTPLEPGS